MENLVNTVLPQSALLQVHTYGKTIKKYKVMNLINDRKGPTIVRAYVNNLEKN